MQIYRVPIIIFSLRTRPHALYSMYTNLNVLFAMLQMNITVELLLYSFSYRIILCIRFRYFCVPNIRVGLAY